MFNFPDAPIFARSVCCTTGKEVEGLRLWIFRNNSKEVKDIWNGWGSYYIVDMKKMRFRIIEEKDLCIPH